MEENMSLVDIIATLNDINRDIDNQLRKIEKFKSKNASSIARVQDNLKGSHNSHDVEIIKALVGMGESLANAESTLQQAIDSVTQASNI